MCDNVCVRQSSCSPGVEEIGTSTEVKMISLVLILLCMLIAMYSIYNRECFSRGSWSFLRDIFMVVLNRTDCIWRPQRTCSRHWSSVKYWWTDVAVSSQSERSRIPRPWYELPVYRTPGSAPPNHCHSDSSACHARVCPARNEYRVLSILVNACDACLHWLSDGGSGEIGGDSRDRTVM